MADEITVTVGVNVQHSTGESFRVPNKSIKLDQSTLRWGTPGVIAINTSENTVDFGDLTLPIVVYLYNLGDTKLNFGFNTGNLEGKVSPGSQAVFELDSGGDLILQSTTSANDVYVVGVQQD